MKKNFWQRLKEVFVPPPDEDENKKEPEKPKQEQKPEKNFFRKIVEYFAPKPKIEIIQPTRVEVKEEKKKFVTETKKEEPKQQEEGFKIQFLKDFFKTGVITIHDLTSDIKNDRVGLKYYSPKQINEKIRELKQFRDKHIKPVENAIAWNIDIIKNRDELIRLKNAESSALNQIRRMKGKDFWYAVDTHFKVHKVLRSEILKQGDDNSLFLNLMKKDIKDAIKNLKKNKISGWEQRIKILNDKLLPAIEYNLKINSMRNLRIDEIEPSLLEELEQASDVTISNNEKDGKYMIMVTVLGESINLFT